MSFAADFDESQLTELMRDFSERMQASLDAVKPFSRVVADSPTLTTMQEGEPGASPSLDAPKKKKKRRKISTGSKSSGKKVRARKVPYFIFEDVGNASVEITGDLQQANEGFDLSISQQICDDGKPQGMGEDMRSYFLMRHNLTYPGPWLTMMSGPMGLDIAGYRLSAEAVKKDDYVLVGNYGNGTMDGVGEKTWYNSRGRLVKTHVTMLAGYKTDAQKAAEAMAGGAQPGGPRFPSFITFTDIKFPTWSSRVRLDMMSNELSLSVNRKVTDRLSFGGRFSTSYDNRKSFVEVGARFKFGERARGAKSSAGGMSGFGASAGAAGPKSSKKYPQTLEFIWNKDSNFLQLHYANHINDNAAMCTRLMWKLGDFDRIMASFGYKYSFGMTGKQISGEICSDGQVKQCVQVPILNNMLLRGFGEMNHWLGLQDLQRGSTPHKYGIQLNIHI